MFLRPKASMNYDSRKNFFDTSAVENVIRLVIQYNPDAVMVIKSTITAGWPTFYTFADAVCHSRHADHEFIKQHVIH